MPTEGATAVEEARVASVLDEEDAVVTLKIAAATSTGGKPCMLVTEDCAEVVVDVTFIPEPSVAATLPDELVFASDSCEQAQCNIGEGGGSYTSL